MRKILLLVIVVGIVALVGRGLLFPGPLPGEPAGSPGRQQNDRDGSADSRTSRVYIQAVEVEHVPEGEVYHVRPTRAGRLADSAELDVAWTQATAGGVPNRAGLRQQFLCHPMSIIARAKPTWDLESWRPAVGTVRTMITACNPG